MYRPPRKKPRRKVYKRTFSKVDVGIHNEPNDKPYETLCAHCGKAGKTHLTLQMCQDCDAVAYCSDECQIAEREKHERSCKCILSTRKIIQSDVRSFDEQPKKYWKEYFGVFYDHKKTRDYCSHRYGLMNLLEKEATSRLETGGHLNAVALEKALEHGLDVMTAIEFDHYNVRCQLPKYMIELGKFQQAYDFLKFWLRVDHEYIEDLSPNGIRPIFMRITDQDPFESVWDLAVVQQAEYNLLLDMALLKLTLFYNIRAAQLMEQKFGKTVAAVIGSFLIQVPNEWLKVNCSDLLVQAQELFSMAQHLQPDRFQWQRCHRMWTNNKVVKNFYTNFVKDIKGSLLPVQDLFVEDMLFD